jgi:TM2 domain-containing membrane protein YozV
MSTEGFDSTKRQGHFDEATDRARESAREFERGAKNLVDNGENKKVLAGLLAIFIGGLGVHKFILGYTQEGILQILLTFLTCGFGQIVPLIEGIIYLTKSDEEFYMTYQVGRKPWF